MFLAKSPVTLRIVVTSLCQKLDFEDITDQTD